MKEIVEFISEFSNLCQENHSDRYQLKFTVVEETLTIVMTEQYSAPIQKLKMHIPTVNIEKFRGKLISMAEKELSNAVLSIEKLL